MREEFRLMRKSKFRDVIDKMPRDMEKLKDCEAIAMYTKVTGGRYAASSLPAKEFTFCTSERLRCT